MRPGLVAAGAVLVAVAIGGVVALFDLPLSAPAVTNTSSTSWVVTPNSSNSTTVTGPSSVSGSFTMHWRATVPLGVAFYRSDGCLPGSSGCASMWTPVSTWSNGVSGSWNASGTVHFPFRFSWTNSGNSTGNLVLGTITVTNAPVVLSALSQVLLLVGVGLLGFLGVIAIFLGLFLRGGVYRRPPPPVPRNEGDPTPTAADRTERDHRVY